MLKALWTNIHMYIDNKLISTHRLASYDTGFRLLNLCVHVPLLIIVLDISTNG